MRGRRSSFLKDGPPGSGTATLGAGRRARALLGALLARDVFVRMPSVAPLDRCIRVTVGAPAERAAFAEALAEVSPLVA